MTKLTRLPDRAVLDVSGPDRVAFLQGLVSNDVAQAVPGQAVWAALLSPQGRWLADFFIFADDQAPEGGRLLLDCAAAEAEALAQRLLRYRLRAKATIAPTDLAVHAAWDGPPPADIGPDGILAADPRLPAAGWRILSAHPLVATATPEEYDRHRLALGLADGGRDLESGRSLLLEAGFDELNGVSWTKGCYMGQELTARTRYRGLVKRRLVPVAASQTLPPPGTAILRDGQEVGTLRSSQGGIGLATLRLEALAGAELVADGVAVSAHPPEWMRLPEK